MSDDNIQLNAKIEDARQILNKLGLSNSKILSPLTLLALCNIKPGDDWAEAAQNPVTLSKGIMDFVSKYYGKQYKPNTRESFRKNALKPFVENGIAVLNPTNPELSNTSSNTHYALTDLALKTIQSFNTPEWDKQLEIFKIGNRIFSEENQTIFLEKITIKNFKSIVNTTIDLGRVNVFIGANGSGKSNILEALAFIGASCDEDLNFDGLYSRGVRIARPDLMMSSFLEKQESDNNVEIFLTLKVDERIEDYSTSLTPLDPKDIYSKWHDSARQEDIPSLLLSYITEIIKTNRTVQGEELISKINSTLNEKGHFTRKEFDNWLSNYAIYDLNTRSLRGLVPPDSRKTPLGLNGEGLDLTISNFSKKSKDELLKYKYFDWLENVFSDPKEQQKYINLKAGKSLSNLYFTDKFMNSQNNTLSAENSNEGILHVLFYLSLFISDKTPQFFSIDNIETALNPRLCRVLIKEIAELSKKYKKQVLITTHNPAVLDGLNLGDNEQRLFEVFRNDEGHTEVRRIKFKDDFSDKTGKLSQMWLNGALGASPKNF